MNLGATPEEMSQVEQAIEEIKNDFNQQYKKFYDLCEEKISATNTGNAVLYGTRAAVTLELLKQKKDTFEQVINALVAAKESLKRQRERIEQFNG